jgi:O-antigen ligase
MAAVFSLVGSFNMAEGIFAWSNMFLAGAFFFICSQILYRYPNGMLLLGRWAMVGGFGLAVLGLMGRYWRISLPEVFFFKGIMVNKNLYASSLYLFLPFVILCLVSDKKRWSRAAGVLLPVMGITILLSFSRTVCLALIFGAVPVVLITCLSFFKNRPVKRSVVVAFFLMVLVGGCFLAFPLVKNTQTVQLRLNLWSRTVQMIQNESIFGIGPGQWRLVLPEYGQALVVNASGGKTETLFQRPHNDFLWVVAETGVLGGASYLGFFFILYYYTFKVFVRAGPDQKALVLSMCYGISGYLIIALFSYPRERGLHSVLVMLMAAAVVASYHRLYPAITKGKKGWVRMLKSTMILLFVGCFLLNGFRLYSEIQLKKALQARAKGEWHKVIAHIDRAFLSVYPLDPFGVPLPWYRGMAHYNMGDLPMALVDFRRAVLYHPHHNRSLHNLAILEKLFIPGYSLYNIRPVVKSRESNYGNPDPWQRQRSRFHGYLPERL